MSGEVRFSTVTCELARHSCKNRGLDFISCGPTRPTPSASAFEQVTAVCREPTATQAFGRIALSGAIGAVSGGALGYAFSDGDRERVTKMAAFGLFTGMFFGGYL